MSTGFNFRCAYCKHSSTITESDYYTNQMHININETSFGGNVGLKVNAIRCPNPNCKRLTLTSSLHEITEELGLYGKHIRWNFAKGHVKQWSLLPDSDAKPLPSYIPKAISDDYYEACKIRDLSPKASATLSRRCLQGMIRDFHGIKKNRLKDEVDALQGVVSSDIWDAIDSIREVGNIGAHMEKDINQIIDIEPGEAQLLIELIETLVEEWYVNRHDRQERLKKIKSISDGKKKTNKFKK